MRHTSLIAAFACALAVRGASAQVAMPGAAAKAAANKAAAATNAHTETMEKGANAPVQQAAKPPAPKTVEAPAAGKPGSSQATGLNVASDGSAMPSMISREIFNYDDGSRRDPFVSLMTTTDLRPTLSDLRLTGILYDASQRRSLATLRDVTNNTQHTVSVGSVLGRMRVAAIRPHVIVFSIDQFGTNRMDSLVLNDSTKVRVR